MQSNRVLQGPFASAGHVCAQRRYGTRHMRRPRGSVAAVRPKRAKRRAAKGRRVLCMRRRRYVGSRVELRAAGAAVYDLNRSKIVHTKWYMYESYKSYLLL